METLDRYFENVCELDIMFNLEKAHFILDEMVSSAIRECVLFVQSCDLDDTFSGNERKYSGNE